MPWTKPMTGEQLQELYERQRSEVRAKFKWDDAARQLAEQTPLTLAEARWVDELEPTGLHPFDVVDQLVLIFRHDWSIQGKMRAIKKLAEMSQVVSNQRTGGDALEPDRS